MNNDMNIFPKNKYILRNKASQTKTQLSQQKQTQKTKKQELKKNIILLLQFDLILTSGAKQKFLCMIGQIKSLFDSIFLCDLHVSICMNF